MTYDDENTESIAEWMAAQNEEIAKYKWIESERVGYDIGWTKASDE